MDNTDENGDENMSLTERTEIYNEENQEVHDNSYSSFAGHSDSVYCTAIHSTPVFEAKFIYSKNSRIW